MCSRDWSSDVCSSDLEEYGKFSSTMEEKGQMRGGEELQPTSTATTVRVKDGKTLTTDGPYAETKEQLGGFFLVECERSEERRVGKEVEISVVAVSLKK